jgi:hypothetical protein
MVIAAAFTVVAGLVLWRASVRPQRSLVESVSSPRESSQVEELKTELSRLQRRLNHNERTTGLLAERVEAGSTSSSTAPSPPSGEEGSEAALPARPRRPTLEQQTARFEKHFANLDALRGDQRDPALEAKFRELLTSDAALKFASLAKLKIEELSCGNQFCRVSLDFGDPSVTRLGQREMQIQLAPLSAGATIYSDPETSRLYAYFATGDQRLPDFPVLEEVALDDSK